MQSYEEFKTLMMDRIKAIDQSYKDMGGAYQPTKQEEMLRDFLADIWGVRFEDESLNDSLKSASVQLMFLSKENPSNCYSKNFRISKLAPKGKKTAPLWYLVSKLSEDNRDYNFFFCPNIYIRTRGNLVNNEKNISASNCYVVDIDEVHMGKPVYNCTEEEIYTYLETTYPFLKECGFSYCLMSGRGLHLYFTLQHTEYLFGAKYRNYRRIEHRKLTGKLIQILGADPACKNLNRVLRVPFSINRKINVRTRFFVKEENREKYSKEMLKELVAPFEEEETAQERVKEKAREPVRKKKEKTAETEKPKKEYTESETEMIHNRAVLGRKTLFQNRRNDLEKWYKLHRTDMKGRRHHFFLIYSIVLKELGFSEEVLERKCIYMNDRLGEPLPDGELLKHISQKKRYMFRNETIAEWLNFTQAEIASFECNYTEEDMLEHRRERSRYFGELEKEKRLAKQEEKEKKIFELIRDNEELSMSELAKVISCSKATAWRWYRKYQEKKTIG